MIFDLMTADLGFAAGVVIMVIIACARGCSLCGK